jgi:MtrB/PioB family decaheme-associated outer membrane protein
MGKIMSKKTKTERAGRANQALHPSKLSLAIAAALLLPQVGAAEPMFMLPLDSDPDLSRYYENYVELGLMNSSAGSAKFGEWTGMDRQGLYGIGNFHYLNRNDQDGKYLEFQGYNLGVDSRSLGARGGVQGGTPGSFDLNLFYEGQPHFQYDDTRFPYAGLGGNNLALPVPAANWPSVTIVSPPAPAGTTTAPGISNSLWVPFTRSYDINTQRDTFGLGGKVHLTDEWEAVAAYTLDHRDGDKVLGAFFGSSPGSARTVQVPYPIDDDTHQFEAFLRYTTDQAQLQLGYYLSIYDTSSDSLGWQSLYGGTNLSAAQTLRLYSTTNCSAPGNTACGAALNVGDAGQMGLLPNNWYQQISATGTYRITPQWRAMGKLSWGWFTQDDNLLSYSVNPVLVNQEATPSAFDGKAEKKLVDLELTGTPIDKLKVKAKYHFYAYDNNSSENDYWIVPGDTTKQFYTTNTNNPPGTPTTPITNPLIGWQEQNVNLNADYRILSRTTLSGGYQWKRINYDNIQNLQYGAGGVTAPEREHATDQLLTVQGRQAMTEMFGGSLRYAYEQRRGSDFQPGSHEAIRPFYLANYNKNAIRAMGDANFTETLSADLWVEWYDMDYNNDDDSCVNGATGADNVGGCMGLDNGKGQTYSFDVQWQPMADLGFNAFYTYGKLDNETRKRQAGAATGQTVLTPNINPAYDYTFGQTNKDNAVGVGVKYKPDPKWVIGAQYSYSYNTTSIDDPSYGAIFGTAANVPIPTDMPESVYKLSEFQLYAKYDITKELTIRANYWYQQQRSDDWAYDGYAPYFNNVMYLDSHQSPNYTNNVFGLSVAYKFQ